MRTQRGRRGNSSIWFISWSMLARWPMRLVSPFSVQHPSRIKVSSFWVLCAAMKTTVRVWDTSLLCFMAPLCKKFHWNFNRKHHTVQLSIASVSLQCTPIDADRQPSVVCNFPLANGSRCSPPRVCDCEAESNWFLLPSHNRGGEDDVVDRLWRLRFGKCTASQAGAAGPQHPAEPLPWAPGACHLLPPAKAVWNHLEGTLWQINSLSIQVFTKTVCNFFRFCWYMIHLSISFSLLSHVYFPRGFPLKTCWFCTIHRGLNHFEPSMLTHGLAPVQGRLLPYQYVIS